MVNSWLGTILDIDEDSDPILGLHGGNEIDRLNRLMDGVDLTALEGSDVTINTDFYILNNKLKFYDGNGHTITIALPAGMSADKTLTLPNANATLATSTASSPNNWANNLQEFRSAFIKLKDADDSHGITLKTTGLVANFDLTFQTPGHATDEVVAYCLKPQSLYNKNLVDPIFTAMNFYIDSNTLKHSTTNSHNDLLVYDSTAGKYIRFARSGIAGYFLRTNAAGTGLEWAAVAGGGGGATVSNSLYDSLQPLGYDYGWYIPGSYQSFGGLLGGITALNMTTSNIATYYDTTNKIMAGEWQIESSTSIGAYTQQFPIVGALKPIIEAMFMIDHHGDFTGNRFYLGLHSRSDTNDASSSDEMSNDSGIVVHSGSSNTDYAILHNGGGAASIRDAALEPKDDLWHKIKIYSDGTNWFYSWDDGSAVTLLTDIPTMNLPLGFVWTHSRNDSQDRQARLFYVRIKQEKGSVTLG